MANDGHCGAAAADGGGACDCAGTPFAGRANQGHCGAAAADILCQDNSANVN